MIKAILIDDEQLSRNTLKKMLALYCPTVEVIGEFENAITATAGLQTIQPDLVFLDVAMPGKSGIDFLRSLKQIDFEVIFVTAHDKYILQAIRFAAVDYLQKPVEKDQLMTAVQNAEKRISQKILSQQLQTFLYNLKPKANQQEMQLCIPSLKGFQVVQVSDIIYCEAENTYTNIHFSNNKKILASRQLLDYEVMLQDFQFFRIHKSYLINMKHIKEYQKGEGGFVVTSNNQTLEVSRRKKEGFLEKMKELYKY
ncbi:MAG: LytTR family DNA-binding domain-containing protein [Ferruginibacter sp.]